jgi:hypothetical protein
MDREALLDYLARYLEYSGPCRIWVIAADLMLPDAEVNKALHNNCRFHWGRDDKGPLVGLRQPAWMEAVVRRKDSCAAA